MKKENKFVIVIEETVVQEFEVIADSAEKALAFAEKQYRNGVFVVAPGEVQFKRMTVVRPIEEITEWYEF